MVARVMSIWATVAAMALLAFRPAHSQLPFGGSEIIFGDPGSGTGPTPHPTQTWKEAVDTFAPEDRDLRTDERFSTDSDLEPVDTRPQSAPRSTDEDFFTEAVDTTVSTPQSHVYRNLITAAWEEAVDTAEHTATGRFGLPTEPTPVYELPETGERENNIPYVGL